MVGSEIREEVGAAVDAASSLAPLDATSLAENFPADYSGQHEVPLIPQRLPILSSKNTSRLQTVYNYLTMPVRRDLLVKLNCG